MFKMLAVVMFITGPLLQHCNGQHVHDSFEGILRIDTSTGRGSGFVVASREGRFEVWTNAHVAGSKGDRVVGVFGAGTNREERFTGVVSWVHYDSNHDAAKIVFDGHYDGGLFVVGTSGGDSELFATGGHPLGGRGYALTVQPESRRNFGVVAAYRPPSIPGQSGSPVVNRQGSVVGVVTLRSGEGKDAVGGMLPISQWTGERVPVSVLDGFGSFSLLPNANP